MKNFERADTTETLSIEAQQALLQYWEASEALKASDTEDAANKAINLLRQADRALWMLKQDPDKLRDRVAIVRKTKRERDEADGAEELR